MRRGRGGLEILIKQDKSKTMGFFSFTQEIAMDLGTANTIITSGGKIVVDEPSVVALDKRTDKMIAVGVRAKLLYV